MGQLTGLSMNRLYEGEKGKREPVELHKRLEPYLPHAMCGSCLDPDSDVSTLKIFMCSEENPDTDCKFGNKVLFIILVIIKISWLYCLCLCI